MRAVVIHEHGGPAVLTYEPRSRTRSPAPASLWSGSRRAASATSTSSCAGGRRASPPSCRTSAAATWSAPSWRTARTAM